MLSSCASLILAASVFAPQPTQVQFDVDRQTPKLELGILSVPLTGDPVSAVRTWALSRREHYGLPAGATLKSTEAFTTRFGASFHLQQMVGSLEVYQAKLVVTLDDQRRVVQVSSSVTPFTRVLDGEKWTLDEAMRRAGATVPLAALRPDGVPYGGAKTFYFSVGDELHAGWIANVHSLDFSKNWYVGMDAVTGERLFLQNRVHHNSLDAKVYPISPGGLDAGVGTTNTVIRELVHPDGGTMIGDTCVTALSDGGMVETPNDAGQLCGTQLMTYNCCPTEGCAPDAGARRIGGTIAVMGFNVQYNVAVCDRLRRATNVGPGRTDYTYEPADPPLNKMAVVPTDVANSDEFAEVHSFYHVNTVYDWMRKLSVTSGTVFGGTPGIEPFKMRDERRMPPVKVAVWSNVMFPNFQELIANAGTCIAQPPCRANTLLRLDNAAFFPRENFSQLPVPGFDTGADTLMIFQGNLADAAYDATVIQHEFGHGAIYATANLSFGDPVVDARSANDEGGALHEGFADYIAAAFNNSATVGPYFGPRVSAGQTRLPGVPVDGYLRSMDNTFTCPSVLWGQVHQDSQHVAAALWTARQTLFQGTDSGETFDAAFYAMLVSITPNADFALIASVMAGRVGAAFPANAMAAAQMTQIFEAKGVIGCTKVLTADSTTLPRPYYGIPNAPRLGSSLVPGPIQFKVVLPNGASTLRVTAVPQSGGGLFPTQAPAVRILAKVGAPITFARQGAALQNDAVFNVAMTTAGQQVAGTVPVNALCNTEVYVTLAATGGATLQGVNVRAEPLVNCMLPMPDAGMPDAGPAGGGSGGAGGGSGGGNSGTTTLPAVGADNTTQQQAPTGCGCSSPADFGAPLAALAMLLWSRRKNLALRQR